MAIRESFYPRNDGILFSENNDDEAHGGLIRCIRERHAARTPDEVSEDG